MTPQIVLGAMLSELADQIALGRWGDVERCVVVISGLKSNAVVTYPIEPPVTTAAELTRAVKWLETDEPTAPGTVQ